MKSYVEGSLGGRTYVLRSLNQVVPLRVEKAIRGLHESQACYTSDSACQEASVGKKMRTAEGVNLF